jgi:multiple sugar transport system permease protein
MLFTGVIGVLFLFPILYGFTVSLRPPANLVGSQTLIPKEITFEFWILFFERAGQQLLSSLLIGTGVSILTLVISVPAAYAFARTDFPGRKFLFYFIIAVMLVPVVMLVVPVAQLWRDLGLYNTLTGIWLAVMIATIPVAIWILRDNFQRLPKNTEETARVYGCTRFQAFVRVILPLAAPAIIAVGFLNFLTAWNEFLFTNILTAPDGPRPAIAYLFSLLNVDATNSWTFVLAGAYIISIPPATFYILSRRYLNKALNF